MKILVSWSGGKDAAWSLHALRQSGEAEVVGLLTTMTEGLERVAIQGLRREVLHAQARAAGLPVVELPMPANPDNATYEARFAAALDGAQARWPGLRHIAFGDLFLDDIRTWRGALCARLGWTPVFPLFGTDTAALAREMIDGGLRATLCCVDTTQLDGRFAGRAFDAALLAALPAGVDPCGERGEFHTCVRDGPMFDRPIALQRGEDYLRDVRFLCTDFTLAPGALRATPGARR